jgi:AcrR family transcriptional regulator
MSGDVKRAYRSDRRREQAEQTRSRVLDAAARVFGERGFEGATVNAIAAEAGISPETVYARFGNKRTVLIELVGRAARGPDARPILEQPGPRAVAAATDQREQLRLFATDIVQRLERVGPLVAVLAGAPSEPELVEVLHRIHGVRRKNLRTLADQLAVNGPLRLGRVAAADTIWALASPELHRLLTGVRGWSRRRYVAWLADALAAALLPDECPVRSS